MFGVGVVGIQISLQSDFWYVVNRATQYARECM